MTGIANLVRVIRKAGFGIVQNSENEEEDGEETEARVRTAELNKQRHLLMIGLLFSIPLIVFSMACRKIGIWFSNQT